MKKSESIPELPVDFNPIDYLELHPDLMELDIENKEAWAAHHYLNHGVNEGREYIKKRYFSISRNDNKKDKKNLKKTVVVHVGLGKCGTSSLQLALDLFKYDFLRYQVFYPTLTNGNAHHDLAPLKSSKIPKAKELWIKTIKKFEESQCEVMILSSEYFLGIPEELLRFIESILREFQVKIFFIGRHQSELLPSIYLQWLKHGIYCGCFNIFYESTKNLWHFPSILQRWGEQFGFENLCCRILESKGDSLAIFSDMFSELGDFLLTPSRDSLRVNDSGVYYSLSLIRLFDRVNSKYSVRSGFPGWEMIMADESDRNPRLRIRVLGVLEWTSKFLPKKGSSFLSASKKKSIAAYYQESNKLFHETYMIGRSPNWHLNN